MVALSEVIALITIVMVAAWATGSLRAMTDYLAGPRAIGNIVLHVGLVCGIVVSSFAFLARLNDGFALLGIYYAALAAVPYALAAGVLIATQARRWFARHRLVCWASTTVGAWLVALSGMHLGYWVDTLLEGHVEPTTAMVVFFAIPLVCEVAYLAWWYSGRPAGAGGARPGSLEWIDATEPDGV